MGKLSGEPAAAVWKSIGVRRMKNEDEPAMDSSSIKRHEKSGRENAQGAG